VDSTHGKDFVLTNYARNLIQVKARQLCRRREFLPADQADLQQELWLMLCERADAFDPAKASLDTFIDRVVNTAVGVILRNRQRRDGAYRHERELLQVAAWEALRVTERLVEFERPLVAAGEVSQAVELRSHRQAEAESENPQLLENLIVNAAQCLTDEEPADAVPPRFAHGSAQEIHLRECFIA
jgi:hypothetical protein